MKKKKRSWTERFRRSNLPRWQGAVIEGIAFDGRTSSEGLTLLVAPGVWRRVGHKLTGLSRALAVLHASATVLRQTA